MKMLKNLASVSKEEQLEFLNSFDIVISDIDGVLLSLAKPIPGSNDALCSLKKIGKQIKFLTNNNLLSHLECHQKLLSAGFNIDKDDLLITALAIVDYLEQNEFNKEIFVIGGEGLREELRNAGFKLADSGPSEITADGASVLKAIADNGNVGAVIIDADANINFIRIQMAISYLRRQDVHFIVGACDKKLPLGKDIILSGPGYFLPPIVEISGRIPIHFAKPSFKLNDFIIKKWNITDPSRVLFIGDSMAEDMIFASNAGYKKLLVLTGVTKSAILSDSEEFKPDYYLQNLQQLDSLIKNM